MGRVVEMHRDLCIPMSWYRDDLAHMVAISTDKLRAPLLIIIY